MQKIPGGEKFEYLVEKITSYLKKVCDEIENRHVGSEGNKAATAFFEDVVRSFGFKTETTLFDCMDWEFGDVLLQALDKTFPAYVGPYSPEIDLETVLVEADTLSSLEKLDVRGKLLLVHGELASEQVMPKNFPFYNPETHQKIIAMLDQKQPAGIIAATGRNYELAGGMYPFPLFEDGDFDIPSVYMKDMDGEALRKFVGKPVKLRFVSKRIPSTGYNVIARKGNCRGSRLLFCAHIDAKKGTPGALDNGSGIVTLLALAELLKEYDKSYCIEIIAFNGEDYYSAPGQQQYLALNKSKLDKIELVVNLDLVGYSKGNTKYSFYECSNGTRERIKKVCSPYLNFSEGQQWYQGDHMIFALNKRQALAFVSENMIELCTHITHTEKDMVSLVDSRKLAELAFVLRDIAREFSDRKL